jgi:chaperonin GroES
MAKTMAKKTKGVGVKPLGDRVLVRVLREEEKERRTDFGLIIPETVTGDSKGTKRGVVVAVGEGKLEDGKRVEIPVREGDEVLFTWGEELTIDEEDYYLINESNLLAVVK